MRFDPQSFRDARGGARRAAMKLFVGPATLKGDLAKIGARFGMAEVRADQPMPRAATLRAWRRDAGPQFVFSVVLPRSVSELGSGALRDPGLDDAIEAARLLEARCILLSTPASVRPTSVYRDRIVALAAKLPQSPTILAWEPNGLWELDEIRQVARAAQVLPVLDAARQELPPGSIVYTRLRGLGESSRLGAGALDHVASQLRGRREAFVVVENGSDAHRTKVALEGAIERSSDLAGGVVVRPVPGRLRAEDEEQ